MKPNRQHIPQPHDGDLNVLSHAQEGQGAQRNATQQIRVSTVDNFQGEEADIVLVSLVRSNAKNKIGFVAAKQRVNVLLTRARDGLVLVGNAECMRAGSRAAPGRASGVWDTVLQHIPVMHGFPALCPRHGTMRSLNSPADFAEHAPRGGCMERCNRRMQCGHRCSAPCHSAAEAHDACDVHVDCRCATCVTLQSLALIAQASVASWRCFASRDGEGHKASHGIETPAVDGQDASHRCARSRHVHHCEAASWVQV